jgi:hypothetical protein
MERDILKKRLWPSSRNRRDEVSLDRGTPGCLANADHVRCAERVAIRHYAWRSQPESPREIANRELPVDIQRVHAEHRARYGAPRIHAELCAEAKPSAARPARVRAQRL